MRPSVAGPDFRIAFTEAQLHHWKLLEIFQQRLAPVLARRKKTRTGLNPRRTLHVGPYLSMLLFALLNPVLKTTRALCAASHLPRVQEEVGGGPVSLGGFSEMQAVCQPELLAGLLRGLSEEALPFFGEARARAQVPDLIANDGTLLLA
jgi:hypothetical protein